MDYKKRKANTTTEQIEIYLDQLKNNIVFRTGVLLTNQPPNMLKDIWEELSTKLNSCGSGPTLTIPEWKKRFIDWKNSVRAKSRKIRAHQEGTGGGEQCRIVLSDQEKRALSLWQNVAVEGTPSVPFAAGLSHLNTSDLGRYELVESEISTEAIYFREPAPRKTRRPKDRKKRKGKVVNRILKKMYKLEKIRLRLKIAEAQAKYPNLEFDSELPSSEDDE